MAAVTGNPESILQHAALPYLARPLESEIGRMRFEDAQQVCGEGSRTHRALRNPVTEFFVSIFELRRSRPGVDLGASGVRHIQPQPVIDVQTQVLRRTWLVAPRQDGI